MTTPQVVGQVVDSYRIIRRLGEGGMGVVFYAENTSIGTPAAVKVLRPELSANQDIVTRFFNEARAATLIKHPGIVKVIHFGQDMFQLDETKEPERCAYFIMEYLSGESLGEKIRREGYLPLDVIATLTGQAAAALGAAHDKAIIHRDLKPDNLFLVADPRLPGGIEVKVLDFGIAKLATETAGVRTKTSMLMGTPGYMSPEQCRGASMVDHRSDIYSLGCIVYEMAVGQRPFANITAQGELISMHQYHPPAAPSSLVPSIPPDLEAVIMCMLAKRPEHRYQTMQELIGDLERLLRGERPVLARKPISSLARPTVPERPVRGNTGVVAPSPPTTLGSAASQAVAAPGSPRYRPLMAGVVLVAAMAVSAALILNRGSGSRHADDSSVAGSTADAGTGGRGEVGQQVAPPSPAASTAASRPDASVAPSATSPPPATPSQPVAEAAVTAVLSETNVPAPDAGPATAIRRRAEEGTGSLSVSVSPWAQVKVDGEDWKLTPVKRVIAAGRHKVVLRNPDLQKSETITITVRAGHEKSIDRDWTKK